jgi:sugar fermentation stimulation protein A
MTYDKVVKGRFIERLNRFIAEVDIDGNIEKVHVKNTGRCKELFVEGVDVYLEPAKNSDRKTKYSLVAVVKGDRLINIDSQIPNAMVYEAMTTNPYLIEEFGEVTFLKRETTYGKSRFDLYYENENQGTKGFIEVKGCTLEEDDYVRFPDAPTTRGTKHVNELKDSLKDEYKSYVFLVVQMEGVKEFSPNIDTDPQFSKALLEAHEAGVVILCFDSLVTPNSIVVNEPVPVSFENVKRKLDS